MSTHAWDDLIVQAKKLTITEVADLSGVNRATLSGLVGGHGRASLTTARMLATRLGVHPETLFPTLDRALAEDLTS